MKVQKNVSPAATASKSWNMGNTEFKNLGTISSTLTIDGLRLIATSDRTMSVTSSNVILDSTEYKYALSTSGGGSSSYRAVSMDISGNSVLKLTAKSSGSDTRNLLVVDSSGAVLGSMSCSSSVSLGVINITGSRTIYIYSENNGIYIYKVQLDTDGTLPGDNANSVTVTSYSDLVPAAKEMANTSGGGIIYVNARTLSATEQLALSSTSGNPVSITGVQQSDGTYPVLDFSSFRAAKVGSTGGSLVASSDDGVGIRITGSNYTVKNLIIEKAPDNGIQIKGANANYNTVENCVLRYNNDSGLQISSGASNNTIKYVCSYRNCDIYTRGGNADGFSPKLGATTGNTFYCCYAWDNSDDGWDSYDGTDSLTYDLSYEECACWNNGNPNVFTGRYDFDNGSALDTDLFLVELIMKQDSSFASNYNNNNFSLPSASFINTNNGSVSASTWIGSSFGGNPNGFKFGSANSGSNLVRTVKRCLTFLHASKGFDNNNSSCTASFESTVGFDNGYNYSIQPFTITKWSNVYGFSGGSSDRLPSGFTVSAPGSGTQSSIRSTVSSTVDRIVSSCYSNIIPGAVYFDIY